MFSFFLLYLSTYNISFLDDKKERINKNQTEALFIDNWKLIFKRILSFFLEQYIYQFLISVIQKDF